MDPSEMHPDLLGEALSQSGQKLAQLGSLLASWATVQARRTERRAAAAAAQSEQQLRELREQETAAWRLARAGWAPARDRQWLASAGLLDAGRAWSAAAAWADADPGAANAQGRCENRLRGLHPYAMARYDRLRAEGAMPFEAMHDVLPLFGRAPSARPGGAATERRALTAPAGGGAPAGGPWQWTDYEEPAAVIIAPVAAGSREPGTRVAANPARLAAQGFPFSAADAVRADATASPQQGPARPRSAERRPAPTR